MLFQSAIDKNLFAHHARIYFERKCHNIAFVHCRSNVVMLNQYIYLYIIIRGAESETVGEKSFRHCVFPNLHDMHEIQNPYHINRYKNMYTYIYSQLDQARGLYPISKSKVINQSLSMQSLHRYIQSQFEKCTCLFTLFQLSSEDSTPKWWIVARV